MFSEESLAALDRFTLSKYHYALRLLRAPVVGGRFPVLITGPLVVLGITLLLFAVCAAPAFIAGRLTPLALGSDLHQLFDGHGAYPPRPIPLLRDYSVLAILVLTALSYVHFARQWHRLERLPVRLARGGLLRTDVLHEHVFVQHFARLQDRSCRVIWEIVALAISIAVVFAIVTAILQTGFYPLIDRGASVADYHLAEWWARPANSKVGFGAFSFVLLAFCYLTIRHTIMGFHMLTWLGSIRRETRPTNSDWFGYSDPWVSPDDALGELRGAILDVFLAILLGACAAAAAVYAIAVPPQLVLILVVYLLYNLSVFVIPWVYLNRQLARSKFRLQSQTLQELRTLSDEGRPYTGRGEWLWLGLERVRLLPERVIQRVPVGALIALYLLPVLGIFPAYR